MRPRILILIPSYLPIVGGAEVAVAALAQRLPQFEFVLVCGRLHRDLPASGRVGPVDVHRVGPGSRFDAWLLPVLGPLEAMALARTGAFAVVHAMGANQAAAAAFVLSLLRSSTPFLLSLTGTRSDLRTASRVLGPLYRQMHRRATEIHALTTWHAEQARSLGYRGPVDVIPFGADPERFRASAGLRASMRERLGIEAETTVLVTVARLVRRKRIDDLIRSLSYLPPSTRVVVAGTGPERIALEALAASEGFGDRVTFLGLIDDDDLPGVLAAGDVFVLPSSEEGFGIASVEAMAAGTPVVATPVDGVRDLVEDAQTGLWCAPGDPRSIATAVMRLQSDAALRRRIVEEARRRAETTYAWDAVATRFAELYERLGAPD